MKTTIYTTYRLVNDETNPNAYGYLDAVHCNYINKITTDSTIINEVDLSFSSVDDFKFLSSGSTETIGFTATKIYFLVQKVLNGNEVQADQWRMYDITNQITGYVSGNTLTANDLVNTKFRIFLDGSNGFINYDNEQEYYNLDYLNYPISTSPDELSFGDEEYFLGNVESDIEARIYSMNIDIPLSNFVVSTNKSWSEDHDVYITEVGVYDADKNLVGIAKLTNPIKGGNNNTIVFGLDF